MATVSCSYDNKRIPRKEATLHLYFVLYWGSLMEKKPLKILYLITKSNIGGAGVYVYDLATEAKKAGHDVVVGFGGHGILETRLRDAGVRTISVESLGRDVDPVADIRSFFALLYVFGNEQPDVIHLNSSKMGGLGALAARLWNSAEWILLFVGKGGKPARIIFTGHGWAFNEERSDLARFVIGLLHWATIELSHQTIAVSKRTRDQVSVLPFVWHKLKVVHNGIGAIGSLEKSEARKQILAGTTFAGRDLADTIVVGTIAEYHKNKGLSYAIEGIALLKKQITTPIVFLVVSDGEERATLEALITKLGLENEVLLAGQRPNASTLLLAFDIFLLPSITEAFPYVILEAGKMGLPVIATAVGGIPEVIDDMQSGILIQSKNPSEIARALKYLIENPQRRAELGRTLAERIRDRFSIETMARETFAIYKKP